MVLLMRILAVTCLSIVGLASVNESRAESVMYKYSSIANATSIGLGASEPISILYGFDTLAPDFNGATNVGQYTLQSLAITLGGFTTVLSNPGYPRGIISINDDNAFDAYSVAFVNSSPVFSGLINGWQLSGGAVSISSLATTQLEDDSLVLSTSLLNSLTHSSLTLNFAGGAQVRHPGQFGGQYTTTPFLIEVVPEPSSLVLCAIGLTAIVVQSCRESHRSGSLGLLAADKRRRARVRR